MSAGEGSPATKGKEKEMNNSTKEFLAAVKRGEFVEYAIGSERGYLAKSSYPDGKFCGIVHFGFRKGLYKYQLPGKGGPHGNSSIYITNVYYRKVNNND